MEDLGCLKRKNKGKGFEWPNFSIFSHLLFKFAMETMCSLNQSAGFLKFEFVIIQFPKDIHQISDFYPDLFFGVSVSNCNGLF